MIWKIIQNLLNRKRGLIFYISDSSKAAAELLHGNWVHSRRSNISVGIHIIWSFDEGDMAARLWTYPPAMLKLSILYNTHISILTLSILRNTQLEYKMLSIYNTQLVFCIIWNPYFKIWNKGLIRLLWSSWVFHTILVEYCKYSTFIIESINKSWAFQILN